MFQASKQANGFKFVKPFLLKRKQASKQARKIIFVKTGLTKIPSSKQANWSEVFRMCTVELGYHTCILVFPGRQT